MKHSIVSAVTKILLGISEASLAPEAKLLVMPMLPINSSTVGGPTICKHNIFVVQNQLCLAEAVHRLVYPPGSWWDRASQIIKSKTGRRRQSLKICSVHFSECQNKTILAFSRMLNSPAGLLNDAIPVAASDETSKSQHHHKTSRRVSLGVVQLQVLKSIFNLVLA